MDSELLKKGPSALPLTTKLQEIVGNFSSQEEYKNWLLYNYVPGNCTISSAIPQRCVDQEWRNWFLHKHIEQDGCLDCHRGMLLWIEDQKSYSDTMHGFIETTKALTKGLFSGLLLGLFAGFAKETRDTINGSINKYR